MQAIRPLKWPQGAFGHQVGVADSPLQARPCISTRVGEFAGGAPLAANSFAAGWSAPGVAQNTQPVFVRELAQGRVVVAVRAQGSQQVG